MKEILFRSKRKDNGEWIYGVPITDEATNDAYIITSTAGASLKSEINNMCATGFRVISNTVGQYTGLTDKNGTRIFEGDIVKVLNAFNAEVVFKKGAFGVYSSCVDYDYLDSEIAEITGCNNPSRFCRCDNFVSLWELMWNYNQEDDCCSVVEIIGNIHDNGYPF